MTIRLLLADDHQIVREGLRALLAQFSDVELVGEAADGLEALRLIDKVRPDVVVIDLLMPGLNGLEVTRQLARKDNAPRIVILSMHAAEGYAHEALSAGAVGYVIKDAGADALLMAIRTAAAGKRYLSPPLTEDGLADYARRAAGAGPDPLAVLTPREREVLQLTAEGLSCADIAGKLFISARTVESHRANMMRKLGVRNQKELVRLAVERGAVLPRP